MPQFHELSVETVPRRSGLVAKVKRATAFGSLPIIAATEAGSEEMSPRNPPRHCAHLPRPRRKSSVSKRPTRRRFRYFPSWFALAKLGARLWPIQSNPRAQLIPGASHLHATNIRSRRGIRLALHLWRVREALRSELMIERGLREQPQASGNEAQHETLCWIGRVGK